MAAPKTSEHRKPTTPAIDRLMPRIYEGETSHDELPCWLFRGSHNPQGYGQIGKGRRGEGQQLTHRVTYTYFRADVPEGLDLDHLCRVRGCCNPWHLEPVTRRVNNLRAVGLGKSNLKKTHCPYGHAYDEANTYRAPGTPNSRMCRACSRLRARARRQAVSA